MAELSQNGMCGAISCQGMRLGIVGSLPMLLMSRALWSGNTDPEREIAEYYKAAFGDGADKCRAALDSVREALHPNILRGVTRVTKDHVKQLASAKKSIKSLDKLLANHLYDEDFPRRVSYLYLGEQLRLSELLIDFLTAAINGEETKAKELWSAVLVRINETEALYPRALDAFEFSLVWHRHVLPLFFPDWKIDYDSGELTM